VHNKQMISAEDDGPYHNYSLLSNSLSHKLTITNHLSSTSPLGRASITFDRDQIVAYSVRSRAIINKTDRDQLLMTSRSSITSLGDRGRP